MAVNMSRSQRKSMLEGATDGRYRKTRPDTAGTPLNTSATVKGKADLDPWFNYGYAAQETPFDLRAVPGC